MIGSKFIFLLVLCGMSLTTVIGQMDLMDSFSNNNHAGDGNGQVQVQENVGTNGVSTEMEDEEEDAMTRLGQVQSIEEFMTLLRRNGRNLTNEDIYDEDPDEDGKLTISGGGRLATPDNCSPRNTTIRITMEETDSDTAFYPRCTKIERCGGCCNSPNLECVPRYTERISLKVMKGKVPYPGAPHLDFTGFASVILDRHVTCRVNCKLTEESCGPLKNFNSRKCDCKCKNRRACPPPTEWDADECTCKCANVQECCATPNCGMVWSPSLCDCVLSNDGRVVIAADNNPEVTTERATTTTTRTTTTTTPTTPTTTEFDPCATQFCLPRFTKVRIGNICRCAPPTRNTRGRNTGGRVRGRG